jgi:cysteine-rich repeat protein
MSPARLPPLVLVALAACFVDVGPSVGGPDGGSSTTSPAVTSAGPTSGVNQTDDDATTTAAPATTTSTTSDDTTQSDPTTGDALSDTTATASTTAMTPSPACGDGVLDDDEQCDDGNLDNSDECLTNCTAASCSDGIVNQDEIGVDCGGQCTPCAVSGPCGPCDSDEDCDVFLGCDGSLCVETHFVDFDWSTNCSEDSTLFAPVSIAYGGNWRVTAIGGGGKRELLGNHGWIADCDGFSLGALGVPFIYDSAEDAFNAIDPKSVDIFYGGGPTACGIYDTVCTNNSGFSQLSLSLVCK